MENQPTFNSVYISEILSKRQVMSKVLAPFNIQVNATAENYKKIKPRLKENNLNFILLEYDYMPNNIHALVKEIKTDNPEIKLLMIGAFNTMEIAETFLKSGADGYYDQHCVDGLEGIAKAMRSIYNGVPVIIPSTHRRV
jgi:DNA-binding NarL/FixJ family response regulator